MQLALDSISKKVGAQTWLYDMSLALQSGAVTVLLGATQAGKTSLMRIMAGLDTPTAGRVTVDGVDVTGMPVRDRNVAMVYQQFINYPSMKVAANIASPLKLRGEKNIDARVREIASRLHIDMFLDRYPAELSGGQQQRVALARALAKGAPLMLLDEPLVNLDYKLREELREELTQLFAAGQSTVVYATTEPGEALLLGGYTAVLDEGQLLQYGPTAEVFHAPNSLRVARAFSDPPMNLMAASATAQGVRLQGGAELTLPLPQGVATAAGLTVGVRASALRVHARPGDVSVAGVVELAEISGSDTFVHASTPWGDLVAQLTGVHYFELGTAITLHLDPAQAYVFGADGRLARRPRGPLPHKEVAEMARISLDLAHSYKPNPQQDSDYALLPLKMEFEDGGAYALLGPSGCGKTTMLNIMSGLLVPSHGKVLFDGRDVTRASPQERNIAQVFQFPVIYDTMTVAENLAFPLRNRKVPEDQIKQRVGVIAEMLEMSGQLNQRAAGLAADAKQKISLGRGLVRADVAAVLFDEPLTVIDPHLKWQLRRKLKQIHHELKLTLIYVTHDQVEALTFADQVVVMTRGKAVQVGSADALFERPAHTFVGHFIGSPGMNFLPAHRDGESLSVAGHRLASPVGRALPDGALQVGIRPEYLALAQPQQAGALPGTVVQVQDIGTYLMLTAKVGEHTVKARFAPETRLPSAGDTAWLQVLGEHTCFYKNEELLA